jgi:DHA2 family multidrug resistance protein
VEWGRGMLAGRGVPETAAEGTSMKMIYGQAVRQATAMGFNDAFWILSVMMVCVLPLLLLMRRPEHQNSPPPPGH